MEDIACLLNVITLKIKSLLTLLTYLLLVAKGYDA